MRPRITPRGQPLAGDAAVLLFVTGIVGAGVLAVPVLTASAAYAIADLRGWSSGLDRPLGS